MKKIEKNAFLEWTKTLTNKELKKEYYKAVYESLGSETEVMYELGYDIADIKEREEYEKFLSEKSHILERLCNERGIKLWKDSK